MDGEISRPPQKICRHFRRVGCIDLAQDLLVNPYKIAAGIISQVGQETKNETQHPYCNDHFHQRKSMSANCLDSRFQVVPALTSVDMLTV